MRSDAIPTYRLAGITLQSELALPELATSDGVARPNWSFRLSTHHPRPPRDGWFHHWPDTNGRPWLSFGREANTYVLRFARLCTFRLTPETGTILCEGSSRVPRKTVRHLLLNQVLPLAIGHHGCFVLHASAVNSLDGVIGFVGDAGAGKSTMSAVLNVSGYEFVGDDALVIRTAPSGCEVLAMYPSVRLWPDSLSLVFGESVVHPTVSHYTTKRRVALSTSQLCSSETLPLRVLCLLAPRRRGGQTDAVTVRQLSRRDAVIGLTAHAFQLDVQDMRQVATDFERLATIAEQVPVVELSYRWKLSRVRDTAAEIIGALDAFK